MAKGKPIVKIAVTHNGKQWFLFPSNSIKKEVIEKGIQKSGFGVYSVRSKNYYRMMKKIRRITDLIVEKKQRKQK